jgi:hypothetical protein
MKKYISMLFAGLMILGLACSKSKDITLELTNPQGIAVAFDGYYKINDEAEVDMTGETPEEYDFTLEKGDDVMGLVYKSDTTNFTDTLHFQVFIDGEERSDLSADIVMPTLFFGIAFSFSAE